MLPGMWDWLLPTQRPPSPGNRLLEPVKQQRSRFREHECVDLDNNYNISISSYILEINMKCITYYKVPKIRDYNALFIFTYKLRGQRLNLATLLPYSHLKQLSYTESK